MQPENHDAVDGGEQGAGERIAGERPSGRLSVAGPNVMAGYLLADQPGVLQPPPEGWYNTGDIVSVDASGHLAIVGRASRIAKPGGEMVSLAAVEDLAAGLWPETLSVAVAVPDVRKGERIVLLTEQPGATRRALQTHARSVGAAELMLPAEVRLMERLPLLGSGKPDFPAAALLAAHMDKPGAADDTADQEDAHVSGE